MGTRIECKLIRKGGTRAEVGGTEYWFQPCTDGAHVADIEDNDHADRFLSITEGYRLYRGEGLPVADTVSESAPGEEGDERASLVEQYIALYGEKPHPRTGIAKLRDLIAAKQ